MSSLPSQHVHAGAFLRPARFLIVGAALALGGCSADLGRFDFPAMGYSGSGAEPTVDRAPPAPVYGDNGSGQQPYQSSQPYNAQPYGAQPQASPYGSASPYGNAPAYGGGYQNSGQAYQPYAQPRSGNTQVARLPDPAPAQGTGPRYEVYSNGVDGGSIDSTRGRPVDNRSRSRDSGSAASGDTVTVRQGDTLYSIAKENSVTISDLRSANGLTSSALKVGQKLDIPGKGRTGDNGASRRSADVPNQRANRRVADAAPLDEPRSSRSGGNDGDYVVRPGDSLYGIARSLGVQSSDLARENNITDPSKLRVGQRLSIPGAQGESRTTTVVVADQSDDRSEEDAPRRVASLDRNAGAEQPDSRYDDSSSESNNSSDDRAADDNASDDRVASLPSEGGNADDMRFRWPVRGRVVQTFGAGSDGKHNDGIDIAVPLGTEVQAAEEGVVAYAGSELKGYGNLILIRHSGDWVTAYAHNEKLLVKRGDKIKRGQAIAKAGRSGSVERPQVHFELRKGSMPVDPLKYMASR